MAKIFSIKNWKPYELIWLCSFLLIAIILTILWKDGWFGFSVFITGIFCVVLAAKGHIATYIFGMYNTIAYAYMAWQNNLYGEVGLNLLFFVPMNILGFYMWKKRMNEDQVQMRGLSIKWVCLTAVLCIVGIFLLGLGLAKIENQNTPFIDATTNILSIAATILMVLRYKEQWLLYIILNIFTIIMWTIRLVNKSPDGAMMIVMWSAYLINSIYGYISWSKGAKAQNK